MDNLVFLSASKDKLLEAIQYIHKKTPIYVSYKKTEAKKGGKKHGRWHTYKNATTDYKTYPF